MRIFVGLLFCLLLFSSSVQASEKEEWIVHVRSEQDVSRLHGEVVDVDGTFVKMELTDEQAIHVRQLPFVKTVEKNCNKQAASFNDPLFSKQWALEYIHWHAAPISSTNLLLGKPFTIDGQTVPYDGQPFTARAFTFHVGDEKLSRVSVRVENAQQWWRVEIFDDQGTLLGENSGTFDRLDVLLPRFSPILHIRVTFAGDTKQPRIMEVKGVNHVLVAVVDSGVVRHEDFGDNVLYSLSVDYVENKAYAEDTYGHGTHVTGILSAVANNGIGIAGVVSGAPVDILPIKVLDRYGVGDDFTIARGVRYALEKGAEVINLSLAGKGKTVVLQSAIEEAIEKGVIVVAAAGNSHVSTADIYPASYVGVITVAATNENDAPLSFSNYGWEVDISAPGEQMVSTYLTGYRTMRGTSMAAPYVTGALALLKAMYKEEDVTQLRQRLWKSAKDVYAKGYDMYTGYGLLQWNRALSMPTPVGVDWLNYHIGQPVERDKTYWLAISPVYEAMTAYVFINNKLANVFPIEQPLLPLSFTSELIRDATVMIADGDRIVAIHPLSTPSDALVFSDVSSTHWAYGAMMEAQKHGWIRGYLDGTFRPNERLTRRQALNMMYRAFHWEEPTRWASSFRDVSLTTTDAFALLAATERGIIKGDRGLARLDDVLTRGQMALLLVRALGLEHQSPAVIYPFRDVKNREVWQAVQLLTERGIVAKASFFHPNDPITRAQFATMLVRTQIRQYSTK